MEERWTTRPIVTQKRFEMCILPNNIFLISIKAKKRGKWNFNSLFRKGKIYGEKTKNVPTHIRYRKERPIFAHSWRTHGKMMLMSVEMKVEIYVTGRSSKYFNFGKKTHRTKCPACKIFIRDQAKSISMFSFGSFYSWILY